MTEIDVLKKDTAYLSIISNTVLVLLKLIVGIWGGAVSLISEALHSSVDLLASLIAFWAVKKSVTPPDMEHDYGHGKFENLSAAVEALLIVAAAGGIVYEAVEHMGQEKMPAMLELGVIIMLVSIVINLWVSQRLIKVGRMTDSQALEADGLHLRADVWTSVGVMLGLVLMKFTGWAWLDGVIAIVVAVIIFREGWKMVVSSTLELTDVSLPEEQESRIMAIIDAVPQAPINCWTFMYSLTAICTCHMCMPFVTSSRTKSGRSLVRLISSYIPSRPVFMPRKRRKASMKMQKNRQKLNNLN